MNLNQVTLPTLDVKRSIKFYQTLGLNLIVETPHYARFECPEGDATFSVHQVDELPSGTGAFIYFEIEELDAQVQQLLTDGIPFDSLPTDQPWLWREARLKDPDNNQLILFRAGDNRKNPPWRVGE